MKNRPDRRCLPVTLFRVTAFGERSPARRQSLTEREAGAEIDHTLYENVPEWMVRPLGEWLFTVLVIDYPMGGRFTAEAQRREKLAQRVLTHHRLATTSSHTYGCTSSSSRAASLRCSASRSLQWTRSISSTPSSSCTTAGRALSLLSPRRRRCGGKVG